MEKHKCKLCLKAFANGRALGGHMRSHMLNLYVNPNPKPPSPPSLSSSEEIKSEMSRNPTARQRSKRVRRPESSWFGDQQHFHEFDHIKNQKQSPEEVVAYCLMMLSRDKWTHKEEEKEKDDEVEPELELESDSDGEVVKVKKTQTRKSYRCETCNRRFKSYQALGGHIASHKKIKLNDQFQHNNNYHQTRNVLVEEKNYECHVCFKVFASGQALGGHKRSHVTTKQVVKQSINLIDLNLPAPSDDDDDDDDDDD